MRDHQILSTPLILVRPFIDQYSLVVGELGKVFDGCSRPEANRQFALFVIQSKIARSKSDGKPVTLFKNYEIVREYQPAES
jgi:hypothetical protein